MTNLTSALITDDESLIEFWENFPAAEDCAFTVDLMDSHPERREASGGGTFEVSVGEVTLGGETYFAAFADDGDDAWDWPSAPHYIVLCTDEESARRGADDLIDEWNARWGE